MYDLYDSADWPSEETRKTSWCHRHIGKTRNADGGEWPWGQRGLFGANLVSPNLEGRAAGRDTRKASTLKEQREAQDERQHLRKERISSKE